MSKTKLQPGDVVSLNPTRGCCNSTQCFEEWVVCGGIGPSATSALGEPLFIVLPVGARGIAERAYQWIAVRQRQVNKVLRRAETQLELDLEDCRE